MRFVPFQGNKTNLLVAICQCRDELTHIDLACPVLQTNVMTTQPYLTALRAAIFASV
jgi:hypothetical protein